MAERTGPKLYSIAAHRGFADALVAGLVPRYRESGFGLARLTLLVPSTRARRTITEAFVRYFGAEGLPGLLLPRMAVVGDLDLDETLGSLLDPLGAGAIPRAVDPMYRWLTLARMIGEQPESSALKGAQALRLAREITATMDRLLAEEIAPEDLLNPQVVTLDKDLAAHWQETLRLFAIVQQHWRFHLDGRGEVDRATRRNLLFRHAAQRWSTHPPATPVIAAGVTGAAPAIAGLLRVVSELPLGAVILPDLDLAMDAAAWDELGRAGAQSAPGAEYFGRGDAVSHPQYHLKLLLNRMGVAREEVQPWHRRGEAAAPPERSYAISNLFLPPAQSRRWADLPAAKRRLAGVRILQTSTPEAEAQAIAVLAREALEMPERRIAIITPDRGLARRIVAHLGRWDIVADDTAGRPLSETAAGRLLLLVAEAVSEGAAPVALMALLTHPLATGGLERREWLGHTRRLERKLRGPRPREGLEPIRLVVAELARQRPGMAAWWKRIEAALAPLVASPSSTTLAKALDHLVAAVSEFGGDAAWAREDGRALAGLVEEVSRAARATGTMVEIADLPLILREVMDEVAVRPPWGGHPRIAIYGLLESRMTRADLVVCAGLNEGVWPGRGVADSLLAPPILRVLGIPGGDFRIGLSAHDLAGALGAPEVILSRARRDESGPTIPSRFLLRVQAMLGDLEPAHRETAAADMGTALTRASAAPAYPRPAPRPDRSQRAVAISATAVDRLLGDPYQFYAGQIMRLGELEGLEAEPGPAWQGTTAHTILQHWHERRREDPELAIASVMHAVLDEQNANPLLRALWEPRLLAALDWVAERIETSDRTVLAVETTGEMRIADVRVHGRADRIDRLPGGGLAIVDYKTGKPPTAAMVEGGLALQLGVLGLIARNGGFPDIQGVPEAFEYWSLGASPKSATGFGYVETPLRVGNKRSGLPPEELLPLAEAKLQFALQAYINGIEPFLARANPDYPAYDTYDQLMRLAEWMVRDAGDAPA